MRQYGLIGHSLSHSFSRNYFSKKFEQEGIVDSSYELFELNSIGQLTDLIQNKKNLVGLNVTIPYKESVLPYLTELDETAKKIGAVNTIRILRSVDHQLLLKGYNTDVIGFRESLKPFLAKEHDRALILGTGGSSKAVSYVLKQLQIPFYFVSRKPENEQSIHYDELDETSIKGFRLIVNCTPLGMHPSIDTLPAIPLGGIGAQHLVYDLVYNPKETLLLKEAKSRGALTVNGLSMLQLQAEAAWRIWNQ